jgi:hypothetical protein
VLQNRGPSDTTAPTCTITCAQTSPSNAATLNFTITFSESVTGFTVGDFTIAGGTKGALGGSGAVYTCDVTPTAYAVTADVSAGVCTDAAGNANTAASQVAINSLRYWFLAGAVPSANCIIAYQPIGAADINASLVNLANPGTFNAVLPGGGPNPSFNTATGWQFTAGQDEYLTTGWTPANSVNRSAIARISGGTLDTGERYVFGTRSTGGTMKFALQITNAASKAVFYNGTGTPYTHSTNIDSGVLAVAGLDPYKDAVDLGNVTSGTYSATHPMVIGAWNSVGTINAYFAGFIQAIAFYDIALTPSQIAAITTAINSLP